MLVKKRKTFRFEPNYHKHTHFLQSTGDLHNTGMVSETVAEKAIWEMIQEEFEKQCMLERFEAKKTIKRWMQAS